MFAGMILTELSFANWAASGLMGTSKARIVAYSLRMFSSSD